MPCFLVNARVNLKRCPLLPHPSRAAECMWLYPPCPAKQVLQADWLREMANQMAYYDKPRLATEEARKIGKLHTFLPGKKGPAPCPACCVASCATGGLHRRGACAWRRNVLAAGL